MSRRTCNGSAEWRLPNGDYLKNVQKEEAPFYRKLTDSVHKVLNTPNNKEAIHMLSEQLEESNEHFKPYLQTAVLDSDFMVLSAYAAGKRTQELKTNHLKFDLNIFASQLKRKYNLCDEDVFSAKCKVDFESIGSEFGDCMQSVPDYHFMFGAFDNDDVVKQKRKRAVGSWVNKDKVARPKVWQKDEFSSDEEDESTPQEVNGLFENLCKAYAKNKRKPVNYFEFVTNESSFSSTVENIFHSSFLSKGGHISLTKDSRDGCHMVEPLKPLDDDEKDEQFVNSSHAILSFTKKDWFNWIEKY